MSTPHLPKVAGFSSTLTPPSQTSPVDRLAAVQDRLAGWIADLTTLHDLTERLARTDELDAALRETLAAGATLVGARRGLVTLAPADGLGTEHTVGLGLAAADLGQIETVPRESASRTRLLDGLEDCLPGGLRTGLASDIPHGSTPSTPNDLPTGLAVEGRPGTRTTADLGGDGPDTPTGHDTPTVPGAPATGEAGVADDVEPEPQADLGLVHPDIPGDETLDPRHREVAARLGFGASYALPLTTHDGTRLGVAVWLYDEPAEPTRRQRHLLELYARCATEHLARTLELARAREEIATVREELLPGRLPRMPGVRMAVRHRTGPRGGGDWYDALPLPEGALGLAVGGVTGAGPGAMAAMGRLRASLRAYAVMEGEDPVAVLSDLELLLRLTEPARTATALFAYAEPAARRIVLAGAGHCPPLIVGPDRTEWVETSLSAPLGMLACWEAPSVELSVRGGETLLLYSDGLLRRTGESTDRAYARLHAVVSAAPAAVRDDPELLADHVLHTMLPDGRDRVDDPEDVVLLVARF
ncbi:serine/threonine-protein phosphatase [Streptomyces sp. RKND-216]|uniref:PP2C family protein-serine/threonine phosphatase n=1 Tax=Streptomyces sp. RKND-216 TaxID=2562581 RepID=UPI00109E2E08|nr:PP2C family protein-serine/threonine phosphatase [Streptomyces sp. RKND-216]THA25550.1 serine/threonine-protein phosphatase [Streptomyces sp. RKND-216]